LFPFIPSSAQKIWTQLGILEDLSAQDWYSASELKISQGHSIGNDIIPIFRRIEKEEIENQKAKFLNAKSPNVKT
jgi:methionyl-tRNA synthetase